MTELILVGLAVIIQGAAAWAAAVLNHRYGWKWSWSLICVGFLLLTIRRGLTLYGLIWVDTPLSILDPDYSSPAAASTTLISSICLLAGVLLIEPMFRAMNVAEQNLRADQQRLTDSLSIAESHLSAAALIQRRLFPEVDYARGGVCVSGSCHPMHFAGGDYYDYLELPGLDVAVVVADVAGHGVGPAILMAELRACLRTAVRQSSDLEFLITESNQMITEFSAAGRFATAFLAVIHPEQHTISYVTAGHEAWLIHANGTTSNLPSSGLPLGINPAENFTVVHTNFSDTDILLLATDGVNETVDSTGSMFGIARMLETVVRNNTQGPHEIVNAIMSEVSSFRGDSEQRDDITVVVARFNSLTNTGDPVSTS